jgi:hypothetical protein
MRNLMKSFPNQLFEKKLNTLRFSVLVTIMTLVCGSTAFSQDLKTQARNIENALGNGIFVDTAKVYDDSSLQLMLNAARLRLAALQSIDQNGLLSRIGAITGARLQQQAISAQINGPSIPGTSVSNLGGTGSTTTVSAPAGQTTTNIAGQPVENTTATLGQINPSVPALPQSSAALPTNFGISSLDALNEMMQLTYEIANLQLLLEGSLSDRYVRNTQVVKPKTTLGFPITISPRYKDAVAFVEIEVINPESGNLNSEPPAVTALLPREKTYNVASITDKTKSIGGGLVTQFVGGGFSFLGSRKSYFLVQDQDTVALMLPPSLSDEDKAKSPHKPNATAFSWQFRPVLGQSFVRGGLKQTFVQIASPLLNAVSCFGKIKIKTYWRKFDSKKGVVKEVIPESIRTIDEQTIPVYDLNPTVGELETEDLGAGLIQTSIEGKYLSGTYIRIGNNYYREGSPGFTSDMTRIRFIASAADIAKYKAFLVSRDGSETEIVNPQAPNVRRQQIQNCSEPPVKQYFSEPVKLVPGTAKSFKIKVEETAAAAKQGETAKFEISLTNISEPTGIVKVFVKGLPNETLSQFTDQSGRLLKLNSAGSIDLSVGQKTFLNVTTNSKTPLGNSNFFVDADRNGDQTEIPISLDVYPNPQVSTLITYYNNSNSVVMATLSNLPSNPASPSIDSYVIFIGGKVFGLSDAPIERFRGVDRDGKPSAQAVLRAVVPTSLLLS